VRAFFSWVLVALGVLGSAVVGMYFWDRKRFRMGLADEKRARAARYKAKAESSEQKALEDKNLINSQAHLRAAADARAKMLKLEQERIALAKKLSQQLEASERARRFNLRHGLTPPPR